MENIVLAIHLILAFGLICVVLLQRSEGGGLGIGGGGGGGAVSGRAAATALGKATWIFAVGFMITSLTLTVMAQRNAGGSVIDGLDSLPAAIETPALPDLGALTVPLPVTDAPVTE